jgi:hypothetical protein
MPGSAEKERGAWAIPAALTGLLAVAFVPSILRSSLLQGDLPGHLETIRWSAAELWPLPWGWDPRYLGGAPAGILYPPLLAWVGGGLARWIGAEWAARTILGLAVLALPFCAYRGARGLGLRPRFAAWAAASTVLFLWLPGAEIGGLVLGWRGMGGSLRQTLLTGNLANALTLPLLFLLLGVLRPAIARPGRWRGAAALLGAILLGHFLVGAAALAAVSGYALWRGCRLRSASNVLRGALVGGAGALAAAPFLLPFVVHLGEASPDGIPFAPYPGAIEWLALAALALLILMHPRWTGHPMIPLLGVLAGFYLLRGGVIPLLDAPPVRMEYHRFRVFLYLATVPALLLLLQSRAGLRRLLLPWRLIVVAGLAWLALTARFDAGGPEPVPTPRLRHDGHRVLVLASPRVQNGSSHGLQVALPAKLGFWVPKGTFVEASPLSRRMFELERLAAGSGTRPRWWAIRITPPDELALLEPEEVAARFREFAVDRVLAREPVSRAVRRLAVGVEDLGNGFGLVYLPPTPWARRLDGSEAAVPSALDADGRRIELTLDPPGAAAVSVAAFSDWRVSEGSATLSVEPPGLLRVEGSGRVVLRIGPRGEEWAGLGIGVLTWLLLGAASLVGRRKTAGTTTA